VYLVPLTFATGCVIFRSALREAYSAPQTSLLNVTVKGKKSREGREWVKRGRITNGRRGRDGRGKGRGSQYPPHVRSPPTFRPRLLLTAGRAPIDRYLLHARRAHSSKPHTAASGGRVEQTDRRTDGRPTVAQTLPTVSFPFGRLDVAVLRLYVCVCVEGGRTASICLSISVSVCVCLSVLRWLVPSRTARR